jgi:hypothetical protein
MDKRDIFLAAALLSAGTIIRFILVMLGEAVTPNTMVAFYSIAIMLVLPTFGEAVAIGLVSGVIMALISSSLFNPAFLLSEPFGAAVSLLVFVTLHYHRKLAPYAATFTATIGSGITFTALALALASGRITEAYIHPADFLVSMCLVIIATALLNALTAGLIHPLLRNYRDRTLV